MSYMYSPTKPHLEGQNYHADKLLIFKLFAYYSNFDFEYAYRQRVGNQLCVVVKYVSKRRENQNDLRGLVTWQT